MVRRIGEAVEEGNGAKLGANRRGRHWREANAAAYGVATDPSAISHQPSAQRADEAENRSICLSTFGGGFETVSVSSSGVPKGIPTRAHSAVKKARSPSR